MKSAATIFGIAGLFFSASGLVFASSAPFASTQLASSISSTNATLNGMATPNGLAAQAWFEWGTLAGFDQVAPPVSVGTGSNAVRVSAGLTGLATGSSYSCRLVVSNALGTVRGVEQRFITGGSVISWGYHVDNESSILPQLTNLVSLAAGGYHNLGLRVDGRVVAWGANGDGQTNVPPNLTNAVAIAAGLYHSLALKSNGMVVAWGANGNGQTNVPPNLTNAVAIAAGCFFSLALKSDGTVVFWGEAQVGNPPAGLSNVVAIAGGHVHALALKHDGSVTGWGNNGTAGYLPQPAGMAGISAIGAGTYHSLAANTNGMVFAWGSDTYGNTNVPAGLSNVIALTAGSGIQSLALRSDGKVVGWGDSYAGTTNVPPDLTDVVVLAAGYGGQGLAIGRIALTPEYLYGHRLTIVSNVNIYYNNYNAFSNRISIYNPSGSASRTGSVVLTEVTNGAPTGVSNSVPIPAIASHASYALNVGGSWSVNGGDGKTYYIFATAYETSATNSLVSQPQDSQWIFQLIGTGPPGGGAVGLGSGLTAPGFTPPPLLTNVVVSGPAFIEENSNAVYTARGFLNDGTTNSNLTPTWSSTTFTISQAGKLTAGSVLADTLVTISGVLTYGNTITNKLTATVVNVQAATLQSLGVSNQQFRLQLSGTTGRRYAIETTTNLGGGNNWTAFTTNQIFSNSVFQLGDPGSSNRSARFYRSRQTP